jgi:capsular polysaccharide biosynthesis protein
MSNQPDIELTLQDILNILIRRKFFIIVFTLIGLVAALVIDLYVIKPTYTSNITLYVDPSNEQLDNIASELSSLNYAKQLVNTYIELLKTQSFYNDIYIKSNSKFTPEFVKKHVAISSVNNTELIKVSVTTESAELSYELAGLIGIAAPDIITRVMGADAIKIADPPLIADKPSNENTIRNTLLGTLIGLAASSLLAIVLEVLDTRVKDEEELENRFDIPVIGGIIDFYDKSTIKKTRNKYAKYYN